MWVVGLGMLCITRAARVMQNIPSSGQHVKTLHLHAHESTRELSQRGIKPGLGMLADGIAHLHDPGLQMFAEEIARRPGLLQSLDPRVKVVSIILLLIALSLSRSLAVIVGLYLVTLVLAWLSSVPMGF